MSQHKVKRSPIEEFLALSDAEKDKVVAEFDKEFVADTFRPLTPAQQRLWKKAKRKLGRPVKGQGHKVISVSVDKGLLKQTDAFVKKTGMTRASLIAHALRAFLPAKENRRSAA